jgi:hypothetical protein
MTKLAALCSSLRRLLAEFQADSRLMTGDDAK